MQGVTRHMAYKPVVLRASPECGDGVRFVSREGLWVGCELILPWLGTPASEYRVCKQRKQLSFKNSGGIKGNIIYCCSSRSRPVFKKVLWLILWGGKMPRAASASSSFASCNRISRCVVANVDHQRKIDLLAYTYAYC